MKRTRLAYILAVGLIVVACGGGEGNGPSSADTPAAPSSTLAGSGGTRPQGGEPGSSQSGDAPTGPSRATFTLDGVEHVFVVGECTVQSFESGGSGPVSGHLMSPGAVIGSSSSAPPPTQNSALRMAVYPSFLEFTVLYLRLGDSLWLVGEPGEYGVPDGLSQFDSYNIEVGDGWNRISGTATYQNNTVRSATGELVTASGPFETICIRGERVQWEDSDFLVRIEVDGDTFELPKSKEFPSDCIVYGEDVKVGVQLDDGSVSIRIRPAYEKGRPETLGTEILLNFRGGGIWSNSDNIEETPGFQISGNVATWTGELSDGAGTSRTFTINADCTHRPSG